MPAVAGQRAGADQDGAREPLGFARGPRQAPGPAEVVRDDVHPLDAERIQRAADERRVGGDGLREAGRDRAAEPRRIPRDRAPLVADRGQQRLPVGARAGVAVQEHDRLARIGRSGLAQRRPHVARAQLRPPHVAFDERPARHQRVRAGRGARERMAADHEARLHQGRAGRGARRHERGAEAGQQRIEALLAVGQQRVRVPALGHRPAALEPCRERVAVDHRDVLVGVRQRAPASRPAMLPPITTACSPIRRICATSCRGRAPASGERMTSCQASFCRVAAQRPYSSRCHNHATTRSTPRVWWPR